MLDAKNYSDTNLLFNSDAKMRKIGRDSVVNEARSQVAAAGDTPVEWHVSNQAAVTELQKIFKDEELSIKVFFTPDIVN